MNHMQNRLVFIPAGVLFGVIIAIGVNSMAENSELDTSARVFPYNGYLEFNGTALNDSVDLQFTVTDNDACVFAEEHDNVSAFSGRFNVNIGSIAGEVPNCVFDSEEVYIQVGVREADSEGEYVALVGQQRIHPVPFAYWAAEGSDFRVDGDLGVGTAAGAAVLHVDGDDSNRPVFRAQQFTVDSEEGTGLVNIVAGASKVSGGYAYHDTRGSSRVRMGDGELIFYVGADNDDGQDTGDTVSFSEILTMDDGGLSNSGGNVTIGDNLDVNGNHTVTGNLTLTGNISDSNGDVTINDNLDITGNIQDTNSEVIINDDLTVTGDTEIQDNAEVGGSLSVGGFTVTEALVTNQGAAIGGNATVGGNMVISGNLDMGIYVRHCNPNSDQFFCACNSGDMVIGGGVNSNNSSDKTVRKSHPAIESGVWGWRVLCVDASQGSGRTCEDAWVICANVTNDGAIE